MANESLKDLAFNIQNDLANGNTAQAAAQMLVVTSNQEARIAELEAFVEKAMANPMIAGMLG